MRIHGKEVAGIREDKESGVEIRSQWFSFVSVINVEDASARAIQFGGRLLGEAAGHPEVGRMAAVCDPLGAVVGLWEPGSHIGARIGLEPNTVCWTELSTSDPVISAGFYSGLFGWTVREEGGYVEYLLSGSSQAGMVSSGSMHDNNGSRWGIYFRVNDCDESAEQAVRLGGSVVLAPTDIPGVGRFCRLMDPSGVEFSAVRLAEG